jgi:hypothetical protein
MVDGLITFLHLLICLAAVCAPIYLPACALFFCHLPICTVYSCLSVHLPTLVTTYPCCYCSYLFSYPSVQLLIYLSACLGICFFVIGPSIGSCLSVHLPSFVATYLFICSSMQVFICSPAHSCGYLPVICSYAHPCSCLSAHLPNFLP